MIRGTLGVNNVLSFKTFTIAILQLQFVDDRNELVFGTMRDFVCDTTNTFVDSFDINTSSENEEFGKEKYQQWQT